MQYLVAIVTNHLMFQIMIPCNFLLILIRAPEQDTGVPSTHL